jgi:hypothetical protein
VLPLCQAGAPPGLGHRRQASSPCRGCGPMYAPRASFSNQESSISQSLTPYIYPMSSCASSGCPRCVQQTCSLGKLGCRRKAGRWNSATKPVNRGNQRRSVHALYLLSPRGSWSRIRTARSSLTPNLRGLMPRGLRTSLRKPVTVGPMSEPPTGECRGSRTNDVHGGYSGGVFATSPSSPMAGCIPAVYTRDGLAGTDHSG